MKTVLGRVDTFLLFQNAIKQECLVGPKFCSSYCSTRTTPNGVTTTTSRWGQL